MAADSIIFSLMLDHTVSDESFHCPGLLARPHYVRSCTKKKLSHFGAPYARFVGHHPFAYCTHDEATKSPTQGRLPPPLLYIHEGSMLRVPKCSIFRLPRLRTISGRCKTSSNHMEQSAYIGLIHSGTSSTFEVMDVADLADAICGVGACELVQIKDLGGTY